MKTGELGGVLHSLSGDWTKVAPGVRVRLHDAPNEEDMAHYQPDGVVIAEVETTAEVVTNYVVEFRAPGRSWLAFANGGDDRKAAERAFEIGAGSRRSTGLSTEYRLVRRTALVTDEVLAAVP